MPKMLTFHAFIAGAQITKLVDYYSKYLAFCEKYHGRGDITDNFGMVHEKVMDAQEFLDTYGIEHEDIDPVEPGPMLRCPACNKQGMTMIAVAKRSYSKRPSGMDTLVSDQVYKCNHCGCVSTHKDAHRENALSQGVRCHGTRNVRVNMEARDNLRRDGKLDQGNIFPQIDAMLFRALRSPAR